MSRTKEAINSDINKVNTSIYEYGTFYNALADAYNAYCTSAINRSHDLYDGFVDAYVGNRQETIDKVASVSTKTEEIGKKITNMLDAVGKYIGDLRNKLYTLNEELSRAEE